MKYQIEIMALCSFFVLSYGQRAFSQSRDSQSKMTEPSVQMSRDTSDVRAIVGGRVILAGTVEAAAIERIGRAAVHKSESSGSVLYAVVGGGYIPADIQTTSMLEGGNGPGDLKKANDAELVSEFAMFQNYPNPFNPSTTIEYALPEQASVEIKVLDVLGREVATLLNEEQQAGAYILRWDADGVASGVYYCRLKAGIFVQIMKMMLIR